MAADRHPGFQWLPATAHHRHPATRDEPVHIVRLRVTLSYFIEPYPARRGWRHRYRYASHGLRFELKRPDETNDEFQKRLNRRALDEEEGRPASGDSGGWRLGSQTRSRGSLHADFWDGTAVDLASRGRIAVFPVTGWWKEQPKRDRSEFGVRYGLVISIRHRSRQPTCGHRLLLRLGPRQWSRRSFAGG